MKKYVLALLVATIAASATSCTFKKTDSDRTGDLSNAPVMEKKDPEYVDSRTDVIAIDSTESWAVAGELTNSWITSTGDLASIGAVNLGDKEACKALSANERQSCYDTINFDDATFANDYKKCELIENASLKKSCSKAVSEGISKTAWTLAGCKPIQDATVRAACEERVRALLNPTSQKACEALSNPADKLQCFDQLILTDVRSGKNTDASACAKVVNPVLKKECEAIIKKGKTTGVAGIASSNSETDCTGKTGTNLQYCQMNLAVSSGNAASCGSITDANIRTACVKDVQNSLTRKAFDEALSTKNPAACDKIADATQKARCKEIVAK